jgi:hypothetical protein
MVAACLAKDPMARPIRMQKLVLELKSLSMAARRAERPGPRDTALEASLRSEIALLEARLNRRLESDRQGVAQSRIETRQRLDATAEYIHDLERKLTASQVRVRKLEESGLNRGHHLDQIGLNLEAHAARIQELAATLAAANGAIEHLDRSAADRDELHLIAQTVESEQERIGNIEATLAGIVSAFERQPESAVNHKQPAQIAQHVEAQSARVDGVEKTAAANAKSQIADLRSAVTRTIPSDAPTQGSQGLVYERIAHITLKSIANNAEIDVINDKFQQILKPLREQLNAALQQNWEEWQIPREADDKWSEEAKRLHADWRQQRIARQKAIDDHCRHC